MHLALLPLSTLPPRLGQGHRLVKVLSLAHATRPHCQSEPVQPPPPLELRAPIAPDQNRLAPFLLSHPSPSYAHLGQDQEGRARRPPLVELRVLPVRPLHPPPSIVPPHLVSSDANLLDSLGAGPRRQRDGSTCTTASSACSNSAPSLSTSRPSPPPLPLPTTVPPLARRSRQALTPLLGSGAFL